MLTEPHKRRWFQFRLRTLFILVAVLAVPLAWLAHERDKVRARNVWLESVGQRGGSYIKYGDGAPDQPAWLRTLLGDDSTADVIILVIGRGGSEADLVHLVGLTQLQGLDLDNIQVTDTGLVHLSGLTQLKALNLDNTQVTDAGLVHLSGLIQLEWLSLDNTQTTDAGRQKLRQSMPNTKIYPEP